MEWRVLLMLLQPNISQSPEDDLEGYWCQYLAAYRCIVTPQPLRSFTRSTLLMTSLPRLSNTSTFHIGLPSASNNGVDLGSRPFALGS